MSIILWIVVGGISGLLSGWLGKRQNLGVTLDVLLGAGGAMVGGVLFQLISPAGVRDVWLGSVFVAMAGAILALVGYHLFARFTQSRADHSSQGLH